MRAVVVMLLVAFGGDAVADDLVALAPLSTLGEESRSKLTVATQNDLATALAEVPGHKVIAGRDLDRAVKKARRRDLRACDGDNKCLAELGQLVGAGVVIYGELGGLGEARVVYLKAVDAASHRELRSTTLELGGADGDAAATRGAAYRLLVPEKYVGTLECKVDIKGATIYVDGRGVGQSPAKPIALSVGTHALRVTHPEYRDYVRFVDIGFDKATPIDVDLKQFPIVSRDLQANPNGGAGDGNVIYRGQEEVPWYREWYSVAGGGALVFVGTAVLFAVLADGIDVDDERVVDPPR